MRHKFTLTVLMLSLLILSGCIVVVPDELPATPASPLSPSQEDFTAAVTGMRVQGMADENAAVAGDPVLMGGRYDAAPRTLDDGDAGAPAMTANAELETMPGDAMQDTDWVELIGVDEQVDQYEYSGSVALPLGGTYSGEYLGCALLSAEDGTGQVLKPAGSLLFFEQNPSISAGDTAIAVASWEYYFAKVDISASDWISDTNGGSAYFYTPVAFHEISTSVYLGWYQSDETSFNSAAGDDESLQIRCAFRRDS